MITPRHRLSGQKVDLVLLKMDIYIIYILNKYMLLYTYIYCIYCKLYDIGIFIDFIGWCIQGSSLPFSTAPKIIKSSLKSWAISDSWFCRISFGKLTCGFRPSLLGLIFSLWFEKQRGCASHCVNSWLVMRGDGPWFVGIFFVGGVGWETSFTTTTLLG